MRNLIAGVATVVAAAVGVVAFIVVIGLLISWPMSILWNDCLVPAVTGLKEVGVLQMWGIIILVSVLFKSRSSSK